MTPLKTPLRLPYLPRSQWPTRESHHADAALAQARQGAGTRLELAAEYVHHLLECPAIGGHGDADCRCGAVAFLAVVESTQVQLSAAVVSEARHAALVAALRMLHGDIRKVARGEHCGAVIDEVAHDWAARLDALLTGAADA